MNSSMLDILACPIDKHYPLELFPIVSEGPIVKEGVLFCTKCSRYYPIIDEIPIMLPDELRERRKTEDIEFLRKWQSKIPDKVIRRGNPWHL
ncbi:MAG: Trm112 family protein [Thermoproteota archaeon]|nr:Trm112 family protein [Thermoproteota archaeon]